MIVQVATNELPALTCCLLALSWLDLALSFIPGAPNKFKVQS